MATDVIMPALGLAQEKGTLLNWLKAEGEPVKKGEPLMEVETDKATVEIEAPASGILASVSANPGDEVPVGQRIALILAPGESAVPEGAPSPAKPLAVAKIPTSAAKAPAQSKEISPASPGRILASPKARRIAREKGIDLSSLKGSGPEGSILAEEVVGAEAARPSESPAQRAGEVIPLSAMGRMMGQRMAQSKQTAPHFYLGIDVDMTEVNRKRAEWKEQKAAVVPSINDFIVWACAKALKQFPSLNSTLTERGVELWSDIHIGIAVALDEGLMVPVIRNAHHLTPHDLPPPNP